MSGIGPVPEEVLTRKLGAADGEEVSFFLRQLRLRLLDTLAGRVALSGTTTTTGGAAPSPGPAGPPGPPGPAAPPYTPDLTAPPTPSGVVVSAGVDFVFITTDAPVFSAGHGYLRTYVYGAQYGGSGPLPTFANAVPVHEFVGQVGSFAAAPGSQWHVWLKWRSVDGEFSTSPAGGTNGYQANVGQLGPGNLADLSVTNAKIVSLAVSKLTAGSLAVGEYIQSSAFTPGGTGFRIDGGGGVEIRNAGATRVFHLGASGSNPVLRVPGLNILANGTATFSGALSAATGTFSGSLNAASGSFSGSISASTIAGSTITGGLIQTASSGKRIVLNEGGSNEGRFYGDRGDGVVELLANIGIATVGGDTVIGSFGSSASTRTALNAQGAKTSTQAEVSGQTVIRSGPVAQASNSSSGAGFLGFGGVGVLGQSSGTAFALTGAAGPGVLGLGGLGAAGADDVAALAVIAASPGAGVIGAASSGAGVAGAAQTGYGGHFIGNATKSALFLELVNNTALPSSGSAGSLAMVRFPSIGGGGGNVRLCYLDQFGTWRYVNSDSAIPTT